MIYAWEKLEKPINCFTVRNAILKDLPNNKIVQYYSANTKIVVVQKCVTSAGTFYRTQFAVDHKLCHVFEASALGLPNEVASPEPSEPVSLKNSNKLASSQKTASKKQKPSAMDVSTKGEERRHRLGFLSRLFIR